MDRGAWWAIIYEFTKGLNTTLVTQQEQQQQPCLTLGVEVKVSYSPIAAELERDLKTLLSSCLATILAKLRPKRCSSMLKSCTQPMPQQSSHLPSLWDAPLSPLSCCDTFWQKFLT